MIPHRLALAFLCGGAIGLWVAALSKLRHDPAGAILCFLAGLGLALVARELRGPAG